MRVNPHYLLTELINRFGESEAPKEIDGNMPPVLAWKKGYLAALNDMFNGLKEPEPEKKENVDG